MFFRRAALALPTYFARAGAATEETDSRCRALAMRLLLHALAITPRFQPLSTHASASSEDWWEAEAQAFMREGRDWDAVRSAMRAAVASEEAPLPGDAHQPPIPGPLPPWSPPPERAPARCKSRRETWALSVAYYGPDFDSFTWQPEDPRATVIGCVQHAVTPLLAGRSATVVNSAGRTDRRAHGACMSMAMCICLCMCIVHTLGHACQWPCAFACP